MLFLRRANLAALFLAVLGIAGCGTQLPANPQRPAISQARYHAPDRSWMLPEANNEDLLYTSTDDGRVDVYSYPKLAKVGELSLYRQGTEGLCIDRDGNVFIPAWAEGGPTGYIYEYAHAGTQPIATLSDPGALNSSCSVDTASGDLAVTNPYQSGYGYGNVAVYKKATGNATYYVVPNTEPEWATYDGDGDLFVDGGSQTGSGSPLAELPKGAGTFTSVTVNESFYMLSLQWTAPYLAVVGAGEKALSIYRVQVSGSTGTVVGVTELQTRRHFGYVGNGQYLIRDKLVLGAGKQHRSLDEWPYPAGGKSLRTIIKNFTPWGVVISPAKGGLQPSR